MKKPTAVIFDRDGTLASVEYVAPKDRSSESWRQFNAAMIFDAPVRRVRAWAEQAYGRCKVIIVSGRMMGDNPYDYRRRYLMEQWLNKHGIPYDYLYMRRGGDFRIDSVVKAEIYEHHIEPYFDIEYVVDDRPQVVEMWRSYGLHVYPVVDPGILPPICRRYP